MHASVIGHKLWAFSSAQPQHDWAASHRTSVDASVPCRPQAAPGSLGMHQKGRRGVLGASLGVRLCTVPHFCTGACGGAKTGYFVALKSVITPRGCPCSAPQFIFGSTLDTLVPVPGSKHASLPSLAAADCVPVPLRLFRQEEAPSLLNSHDQCTIALKSRLNSQGDSGRSAL